MVKYRWRREVPLYVMILPAALLVLIYSYGPMFGIIMAFQKYIPTKGILGSKWVGLHNFEYVLNIPGIYQILWNTVFIATMKIIAGLLVPVIIALLLNELKFVFLKRVVQTVIYLPHFLSWVIVGGILLDVLSPSSGIVNQTLGLMGIKPIFFLGKDTIFPYVIVVSDTWKEFGFGTIIYLAALSGVDPNLYEAAFMDGANRWKQTLHITLPGIKAIIVLMTVLSLGSVLNAGFDQIFNLYSPQVYSTGDILDTLVYRLGLVDAQYSVATAVGLFKSIVSLVMILISYKLADKFANYRIF